MSGVGKLPSICKLPPIRVAVHKCVIRSATAKVFSRQAIKIIYRSLICIGLINNVPTNIAYARGREVSNNAAKSCIQTGARYPGTKHRYKSIIKGVGSDATNTSTNFATNTSTNTRCGLAELLT